MTDPLSNALGIDPVDPAPVVPDPTAQPEPPAPWGDDKDFDAAKAKSLINGLKADKERLAARAFGSPEEFQAAQAALQTVQSLEEASRTDLDRANLEVSRWQQETDKWRTTAVQAQVQALASEFADPEDAVAQVGDMTRFIDAGGSIDTDGIRRELDSLLDRKPHYRKAGNPAPAGPRAPRPNLAQGSPGNPLPLTPAEEFAAIMRGQLGGPR